MLIKRVNDYVSLNSYKMFNVKHVEMCYGNDKILCETLKVIMHFEVTILSVLFFLSTRIQMRALII